MQSVEPVLENAIKTLQKVVDVRGMGKKWVLLTLTKWYKDNQCLLRRQEAGIPVITNIYEAILLLNLS